MLIREKLYFFSVFTLDDSIPQQMQSTQGNVQLCKVTEKIMNEGMNSFARYSSVSFTNIIECGLEGLTSN